MTVAATQAVGASVGSGDPQQVHRLPLVEVVAHPANPRGPVAAGDEGLAELVESIRSMGVLGDLEQDDLDAAQALATETLRGRGVPIHAWQAITHDDLIAWRPFPMSVPQ